MHRARPLCFLLALSAGGCAAISAPRYTANLRGLAAPEPPAEVHGGITVAVEAVTQSSWHDHPSLWMNLQWDTADTSNISSPQRNGAVVSSTELAHLHTQETADVTVVPVPGFLIQIDNHSGHDIALAHAHLVLNDGLGHRFPWIADRAAILHRAQDDLVARYPLLAGRFQRMPQLAEFRRMQTDLDVLSAETTIGDGQAYRGYAAFDLDTASLDDLRAFTVHARQITIEMDLDGTSPPFHFTFPVQRKPPGVACAGGVRRAAIIECPEQDWATQPAADGPCIQQTHKKNSLYATQWWIGGVPVANNDLFRTMLADPLTRPQMKRGLLLRGIGYSLVGAGVILSAVAAPVLIHAAGPGAGPDALGFSGLSLAGAIIAALSNRAQDKALYLFNQQADVTGFCAPVW